MLAKEMKRGSIVNYNDSPCMIETIKTQTPSARGGATLYKIRARDLQAKQKVDFTLKGTESLDEADFLRRQVKFLYADADNYCLMDDENFEQYEVAKEDIVEEAKYITESVEGILALLYNDLCIGVQLPSAVALKVVECDPGMKSASATARTKPATLETGLVVQVPEYLEQGQMIKVDTRNGEYLSRV